MGTGRLAAWLRKEGLDKRATQEEINTAIEARALRQKETNEEKARLAKEKREQAERDKKLATEGKLNPTQIQSATELRMYLDKTKFGDMEATSISNFALQIKSRTSIDGGIEYKIADTKSWKLSVFAENKAFFRQLDRKGLIEYNAQTKTVYMDSPSAYIYITYKDGSTFAWYKGHYPKTLKNVASMVAHSNKSRDNGYYVVGRVGIGKDSDNKHKLVY